MIRSLIRFAWKVVKWPFLLTLPFTFLPFALAFISGVTFAFWNDAIVYENTEKWLFEMKDALGDWGVGGSAPTFRQYQDTHNAFNTMRINSNDFLQKLDFILPEQYTDGTIWPNLEDLPIDKYADIENLVRDTSPTAKGGKAEKPREQWVYLTNYGFVRYPWDDGFYYAKNFEQGDRKLNQTGLYIADCEDTASFLCGVWNTRHPALVHFLVEDEPLNISELEEAGISYAGDIQYLRPVTVRIVEFPLKDQYTGLPWTTFPSEEQQFLSIMTGDRLYEQFEPYNPLQQLVTRFSEHMDKTYWENKWHVLYYSNKLDEAIRDHITVPMGVDDPLDFIYQVTFIMTSNIVGICVVTPMRVVMDIVGMFLGKQRRGDAILGDIGDDFVGEPANIVDDIFGGMLAGFMANMSERMNSMSSESVMDRAQSSAGAGGSSSITTTTP